MTVLQSVIVITKCWKKSLRSVASNTKFGNYYKVKRNKGHINHIRKRTLVMALRFVHNCRR